MDKLVVVAMSWLVPCWTVACHHRAVPDNGLGNQTGVAPITASEIEAHIRFLSDDLLAGRGVGEPGLAVAALYQESFFRGLGLEPAFGSSYRQPFTVRGSRPDPGASLEVVTDEERLAFALGPEFVINSQRTDCPPVVEAEVVYCGFCIQAPGRDWDDIKGRDLTGKVLLVEVNEPGNREGGIFDGETMTYYGRWTYKFEQAERLGAAGVLIVHDDRGAGYGWDVVENSWTAEDFVLGDVRPKLSFFGWLHEKSARRLLALAGRDRDALRRAAEGKEFTPVDLGVRVRARQKPVFRTVETENVAAVLPAGRDTDRFVILSAHFDHLGTATQGSEDRIYNGAVDNCAASATMLALARFYARQPGGPPVHLLFAAVSAEEAGLLGSRWLAEHLPVPADRVLADVNFEMTNVWGPTEDVYAIGARLSDLDAVCRKAAEYLGLRYIPEQSTEQGFFYRSDQLSFARAGIPAVWLHEGLVSEGSDRDFTRRHRAAYRRERYHKTSDEIQPDWDLTGAVQIARWTQAIIALLARAEKSPAFDPASSFPRKTNTPEPEAGDDR